MDIDFDKIREESVDEYMSQFKDDNATIKMIEQIASISSKIAKRMLIKYHEELNKSQD